jgi:hypothetical protein
MRPIARIFDQPHRVTLAIVIVAAAYLITLGLLPRNGVWIADNGNKLIQLRGILNSNYSDYSITWPGKAIDPGLAYSPIRPPFAVVRDGRLYPIFSPVFATVSAPLFKIFGYWGLYILPMASSILMLLGLVKTVDILGASNTAKVYATILAGICTPIWFYSVVFWEHTIAACLCIWGISFCLRFLKHRFRRHLIYGAALATLSIYFRDELYSLCLVLLVTVTASARGKRAETAVSFAAAVIAAIIPLWLIQWKMIGQPFGFHLGTHLLSTTGISDHLWARPQVLYRLFAASSQHLWLSIVLMSPFILAFLWNPNLSRGGFRIAVPLYSLIASAAAILILSCYLSSKTTVMCMGYSNSLFAASPVLILAFMRWRDPATAALEISLRRLVWVIALSYAVLYGVVAPEMGSWGIHWGNRLLLVLYPLLAIPAAINLADWQESFRKRTNWQQAAVILAVAISLAAQVHSINILNKKKIFSRRLNQQVQKYTGDIVVTNQWWVAQELFSQFYEKSIFRITSHREYQNLSRLLATKGYDRFLFLTPQFDPRRSGHVIGELTDQGLGFWYLQAVDVNTHRGP